MQLLVKWQLQSEREQWQAMVKDTGLAEKYGTSWHLTKKQVAKIFLEYLIRLPVVCCVGANLVADRNWDYCKQGMS